MIPIQLMTQALDAETLAGLADDNGDGVADAGVLEAAAVAAEEEVRARLADANLAPGELPALLRDLIATLAVERLFERRREMLPGPWAERSARARALLRDLAEGRLALTARPLVEVSDAPPPLHRRANLEPY